MWLRVWLGFVIGVGVLFLATGRVAAGAAFIVLPLVAAAAGRASARRRKAQVAVDTRDTGELLTVEQVAEMLNAREDHVLNLVARDAIPHVRTGGPWWRPEFRFDRNQVVEWLREEERRGPQSP